MGSLRELQRTDERISSLRKQIESFDPKLAEIEDPALRLEAELAKVEGRLAEMEADARRLERSVNDKRDREKKLQERLQGVQNVREETAVRTELDLTQRAKENDEHEVLQLMDRIGRAETARDELTEGLAEAREEVATQQEDLLAERSALRAELDELESSRADTLDGVTGSERKVYEAFHASGRSVVVATLLEDGACGYCFGVVPLQVQNEIRHSETLIRCESCGVILSPEPAPDPAGEGGVEEE